MEDTSNECSAWLSREIRRTAQGCFVHTTGSIVVPWRPYCPGLTPPTPT
jgi:hypothetical protein